MALPDEFRVDQVAALQASETNNRSEPLVPDGALYVGRDGDGGLHHYVIEEQCIYVDAFHGGVEEHSLGSSGLLGTWIEIVRDECGWESLDMTALLNALTEARR